MMLRDFWGYRDELSIIDGLVLKGTRIIVPKSCCDEVVAKLCEGHFGIERTKFQARDNVYWLLMYKDIEDMVTTCKTCQGSLGGTIKNPVLSKELPLVAWDLARIRLI